MFDKSDGVFPSNRGCTFLSHCAVSPLYGGALRREVELAGIQARSGVELAERYEAILSGLHESAALLLRVRPDDVAFVRNTAEGVNLIANGYPFRPGDQVITYVHEYPANYYPWKAQARRGVDVVELANTDGGGRFPEGLPGGWSLDELERRITPRTRVVAISHVQFASGFACDLEAVGRLCRERGVDLVVDAAQSLGCLPIDPQRDGISAVVSSGWKWLLGPMATGLCHTSEALREKLEHTMFGAEMMSQGRDYLDHSWRPCRTSKMFEYSTSPAALVGALDACLREVHLRYGVEAISREIFRLQDVLLERLGPRVRRPEPVDARARSGILSLACARPASDVVAALAERSIVCSARGGYLRVGAHFYNTDRQMVELADALNAVA